MNQLVVLAVAAALEPAVSDPRKIDDGVPTSVPAPEGEDVPTDGAAMVDEPDLAAEPVRSEPPARRPAVEPPPEKRRWPESKRRGGLLLAGIGAGGCPQDECADLKAVPWFNLTGGYRFGRFAPILTVQGGVGPAKAPGAIASDDLVFVLDSSKDTRGFLHVGAGTLLHLLVTTPFDPYFGLTIGYFRSSARFRGEGTAQDVPEAIAFDVAEAVHRGALGVIIGMGFRLRQHLSIGPRVDVLVPFAGKACVGQMGASKSCVKLGDLEGIDPGQYFPRPWAVTLQIGAVI